MILKLFAPLYGASSYNPFSMYSLTKQQDTFIRTLDRVFLSIFGRCGRQSTRTRTYPSEYRRSPTPEGWASAPAFPLRSSWRDRDNIYSGSLSRIHHFEPELYWIRYRH